MDPRVSHRIPIHYPIVFLGDNFTGEGTVVDISEDGCAVGSAVTVGPGTRLTLDIFLPDVEVPIAIDQAVVRWSVDRVFGVAFLRMGTEELQRLRRVVTPLEARPSH